MIRRLPPALLLATLISCAAPSSSSSSSPSSTPTSVVDGARGATSPGDASGPAVPHIFVIAMENESAGAIYGSSHAPYINGVLVPTYASGSNFIDELPSLPSEPHYIQMEAGTNAFADMTFMTDNSPSASNSTSSTAHLATQIGTAGGELDWMVYVESVDLSAYPCPIVNAGTYVPRHDPFLFFQDVAGAPPAKTNGNCAAHHRLMSALNDDLAAGTVPSYVFIVPDLCHDMHGTAACPSTDNVKMGDMWLSSAMPPLIDFVNAAGGVIFIIWDEESHVPFFAVGPTVKAGYSSPARLTHRSLTKTVEEMLGLPILPTVTDASDFGDLFVSGAVR